MVSAAALRRPQISNRMQYGAKLAYGAGTFGFEDKSIGASDVAANMIQLQGSVQESSGMGIGIDAKQIYAGENAYLGTSNESAVSQLDAFVFFVADADGDSYRVAVRVGPYIDLTRTESENTGAGTDYFGIGGRFEIEPEYRLVGHRSDRANLFARLAAGVHGTTIRDGASDESYDSSGRSWNAELGLRMRFDATLFSVAWLHRENTTRDSKKAGNGIEFARLDTSFQGITISFQTRF